MLVLSGRVGIAEGLAPLDVVGRTVEEDHRVRVLLEGAGAADIGELRAFVLAPLCPAVALSEQEDRAVEVLGERQRPVGDLLQATYPMLPQAVQVMAAWGFPYVTGGTWVKRGTSGKLAMGTGYVLRSCSEIFLLGKHGSPRTCSRSIRNVIEAPRREHSRKPEEAYAMAEDLFGPARRADLFSRASRPGWDAWGNEAGKFDAAAAAPLPVAAE